MAQTIIRSQTTPLIPSKRFKHAIPADMVTPERAKVRNLFPSATHESKSEEEPIFVSLNLFQYKILKGSDGINLKEDEKMKMEKFLVRHSKVL